MRANRWIMTMTSAPGAARVRLHCVIVAMILARIAQPTTSMGVEPEYRTLEDYGLVGNVRSITICRHLEFGDGWSEPCGDSTMITFDALGRQISEVFMTGRPNRDSPWGTFWEFDDSAGCVVIRYITFGPRIGSDGVGGYDSVVASNVEMFRYPPVSNGNPRGRVEIDRVCATERTKDYDYNGNWIRSRCREREGIGTTPAIFRVTERRIVYGAGRTDSPSLGR